MKGLHAASRALVGIVMPGSVLTGFELLATKVAECRRASAFRDIVSPKVSQEENNLSIIVTKVLDDKAFFTLKFFFAFAVSMYFRPFHFFPSLFVLFPAVCRMLDSSEYQRERGL
jgi:hypothetical protein